MVRLTKMAQSYVIWAAGLSFFYLIAPMMSYLIFWGFLPEMSLTLLFSAMLIPTFGWRILLLFTDQMRFRSQELTLGFLLLVWISLLQLLWYPTLSAQLGTNKVSSILAFTFIGTWILWLGGEGLAYLIAQKQRLVQIAISAVWVGLVLIILEGVIRGFKLYGLLFFPFQDPVSREVYNYLALADSLAITSLLALSLARGHKLWRTLGLYFVTAVFLLFAYSRTSFFLFLIVGLTCLCLKFRARLKRQAFLVLLGTGTLILIIFLLQPALGYDEDFLRSTHLVLERISTPFTSGDPSLQQRGELLIRGLELLKEHWLIGYFMIEAVAIGKGAYIHNWLSFWLAYGIGPFLLCLWIMFSLMAKSWRMGKRVPLGLSAFSLLVFSFLAIVVARSYIWPYVWLALGFAGATLSYQRRGQFVQ